MSITMMGIKSHHKPRSWVLRITTMWMSITMMGIKSHYKPVHGYCVNLNLPWWELQPRAAHAHCQQHDTYGAGQLANSICARTSTATHWYLSQEYIPRVCLPSHLHDTASRRPGRGKRSFPLTSFSHSFAPRWNWILPADLYCPQLAKVIILYSE